MYTSRKLIKDQLEVIHAILDLTTFLVNSFIPKTPGQNLDTKLVKSKVIDLDKSEYIKSNIPSV